MNEKIIVYENFLTENDRLKIKEKIYFLKNHYQPIYDYIPNDRIASLCAHTLGNAVYTKRRLNRKVNQIMIENFSTLYEKTIYALKSIFNIENISLADFSVPGFHVYRGVELNNYLKDLKYHIDTDVLTHVEINTDSIDNKFIWSFSSLIENTKDPAYLDYNEDKFYYEYGKLNIWNHSLAHRIGASQFSNNDSRITYQGHIYKQKGTDNYYLYF